MTTSSPNSTDSLHKGGGDADNNKTDSPPHAAPDNETFHAEPSTEPFADDGWINKAGAPAGRLTRPSKAKSVDFVKKNPEGIGTRHDGRERYFDAAFPRGGALVGDFACARATRLTPDASSGKVVQ